MKQIPQPGAAGLVARGACMGVADVIPGVSGGTMALILGIYRPLIEGVRSIRLDLPLLALRAPASADGRAALVAAVREIHLRFLIPLGIGIAGAFAVGSKVIPRLMDLHPEPMRGLFFGLILASVAVPLQLLQRRSRAQLAAAFALALAAGAAGYVLTDPRMNLDATTEWVELRVPGSAPMPFKEVLRLGPAGGTPGAVFWDEARNAELRAAVQAADARLYTELHDSYRRIAPGDKDALKRERDRYAVVPVPAGTVVRLPRPSHALVFAAGAIAICAMVLPGISGSFLLLVMGLYTFVLNALGGTLHGLAGGALPTAPLGFLVVFVAGIAIGITLFSRLLSWLLEHHHDATMGALVGLMVGGLRGVWPWRSVGANALPADLAAAGTPLATVAVGVAIVIGLQVVDARLRHRGEEL